MNEKSPHQKSADSPWRIEPGSAVDILDTEIRFKREMMRSMRAEIKQCAVQHDFSYTLEEGQDEIKLEVEKEHFALLFSHLKPLLHSANEILEHHAKDIRMRLRIQGTTLTIALESTGEGGET